MTQSFITLCHIMLGHCMILGMGKSQCNVMQHKVTRIDSSFTSVLRQSNLRVGKWHVRVLNKPQVLVCLACRKTIFF